jgi:hypothetical protein
MNTRTKFLLNSWISLKFRLHASRTYEHLTRIIVEPETFPKPVDGAPHHTRIFLQKKRIEVGNHDQVPKVSPKKE